MPASPAFAWIDNAALTPDALWQLLACAGLLALRLTPLVLLSPWLLAELAPRLVQAAIGFVLVVCLLPSSLPAAPSLPTSLLPWLALALRELAIGLVLGFSLALPVSALRWAGELIHAAAGDNLGEGQGFALAAREDPPIARLYGFLAVALFVTLGGHRLALSAIAQSLQTVPIGTLSAATDPARLALSVVQLLGSSLTTATLVALPVLLALALSDVLIALLARLSSISFLPALAQGVRPLVLLAVVWMGLISLTGTLPQWFRESLVAAHRLWTTP